MNDASLYHDVTCRYFEKPGSKNTEGVLEVAARRADELGIEKILVATNTGQTAFDALEFFGSGIKIIAVTHVTGFREPDFQELPEEVRLKLESKGVTVLTWTTKVSPDFILTGVASAIE